MNVKIYSTSWCPSCDAAKRFLTAKGVAFQEVDIESWDRPREQLEAVTGRRTVPQIVVGDTLVGGWDDLRALDRSGAFDAMLAEQPAGRA